MAAADAAMAAAAAATPPLEEAAASPPLSPLSPPPSSAKKRKGESSSSSGSRDKAKKAKRQRREKDKGEADPSKPSAARVVPGLDGSAVKKKQSKFLVDLRYDMSLPRIPRQAKFLDFPHAPDRLYRYALSSLDMTRRHLLLEEPNTGIELNVAEVDLWKAPAGPADPAPLPADEPLIRAAEAESTRTRMQRPSNPGVTWLRKANYLTDTLTVSSHTPGFKRMTTESAAAEAAASGRHHVSRAAGEGAEEELTGEALRQAQIREIEATFAAAREAPRHPSKPGLEAVKVVDLVPDDALAAEFLSMVRFDTAPDAEVRRDAASDAEAREMMGQSLLMERVASMSKNRAPSHALYARKPDEEEEEGAPATYKWIREYDVRPTPAVNRDDNFFFVVGEDVVRYARIDQRLFLRKKALAAQDADRAAMELLLGDANATPATAQPRAAAAAAAGGGGGDDDGDDDTAAAAAADEESD